MNHIVQQLLAGEKRQTGEADMILEAAGWAAASYANFDRARVATEGDQAAVVSCDRTALRRLRFRFAASARLTIAQRCSGHLPRTR